MRKGLQENYRLLVEAGELDEDPAQATAVVRLERLASELARWQSGKSWFPRLLTSNPMPRPQGLYIYGKVGRGKTMLMDLFFNSVLMAKKRRVHFHQFMAEVHDQIGEARKTHKGDPISLVARNISRQTALICLDEFNVLDIVDAMILGRLFEALFEAGIVVVATSNSAPHDLYKNGLNRALFEPFIDLLTRHMDVLELVAARDFRLQKLIGRPLYFTPLDESAQMQMDRMWAQLTGASMVKQVDLDVQGRILSVPMAAMGVGRFDFTDLCAKPLGSLDYLRLTQTFHTVMIDAIPVLKPDKRNEARRFINLIDTLYDNRIALIASAEAEPHSLYMEGDGSAQFERTASRLIEMRSQFYLLERAARRAKAEIAPKAKVDPKHVDRTVTGG